MSTDRGWPNGCWPPESAAGAHVQSAQAVVQAPNMLRSRATRRVQDPERRAASVHALMTALRPDAEPFERWVTTHGDRVDWPWVLDRAVAHKVAALVAARLDSCRRTLALSPDVRKRLGRIQQESAQHTDVARRTLIRLDEEFRRDGIPFLVVKGSVLAEHVYCDPRIRRFVDVDIVVPREAVARAEARLRSLGYRLGQADELLAARPSRAGERATAEALTRRFYERFHYELPFDAPRDGRWLPVDLHWHIAPASRLRAPAERLWEQTAVLTVAHTQITTLNPLATVIYLAVHATTCSLSGFRLLHLCDAAWAMTRFADQCGELWDLARAWGCATHLASVLETVERVLGVPIPAVLRDAPHRRVPFTPLFRSAVTETFLVEAGRDAGWSRWERIRAEAVWNLAMRCLRWNLMRSLRVRLTRLHWKVLRWRDATLVSAAPHEP